MAGVLRGILHGLAAVLFLAAVVLAFRKSLWGADDGFARTVVTPGRLERLDYGCLAFGNRLVFGSARWTYSDEAAFRGRVLNAGVATNWWRAKFFRPRLNLDVSGVWRAAPQFELRRELVPGGRRTSWAVGLPYWMLAVPLLVLHAGVLVRSLRACARLARSKWGYCRHCGYDLRGGGSPVCPECGTPTAPSGAGTGTTATAPADMVSPLPPSSTVVR